MLGETGDVAADREDGSPDGEGRGVEVVDEVVDDRDAGCACTVPNLP